MLTKFLFIVLAGTFLLFNTLYADELIDNEISYMSDIEVFGKFDKNIRQYQIHNGKRFVTEPYGQTEAILFIAETLRKKGKARKVSTQQFKMPPTFVGHFITSYDSVFPNGDKFSLFQADNFTALGYYTEDNQLVFDVLSGGGAFSAPQLWGAYDQLIGKNYHSYMEQLIGNGKRDHMGTMKASYSIGYTAVLSEEDFSTYGYLYNQAVSNTYDLLIKSDGSGLNNNIVVSR